MKAVTSYSWLHQGFLHRKTKLRNRLRRFRETNGSNRSISLSAALENQITPAVFPNISKTVKILCEAANGPTTPDTDPLIRERGIVVLPDFLTNAGGVTCSYFEQVQGSMNYFWDIDEVFEKLEFCMTKAFKAVYKLAAEKNLYMRDAAYTIAINRVAEAVKLRGWA